MRSLASSDNWQAERSCERPAQRRCGDSPGGWRRPSWRLRAALAAKFHTRSDYIFRKLSAQTKCLVRTTTSAAAAAQKQQSVKWDQDDRQRSAGKRCLQTDPFFIGLYLGEGIESKTDVLALSDDCSIRTIVNLAADISAITAWAVQHDLLARLQCEPEAAAIFCCCDDRPVHR